MKKEARFSILALSEDLKTILFEKSAPRDATFEDFKSAMPKDECRWAFYDLDFETKEHSQ
jgi:hypothetical protein